MYLNKGSCSNRACGYVDFDPRLAYLALVVGTKAKASTSFGRSILRACLSFLWKRWEITYVTIVVPDELFRW